ncbi:hypothetical protein [Desulfocicer niacini]
MEEKNVKSIPMANDLTLELLDLSRKISVDAYQVTMVARLVIPVKESLFSEGTLKEISLENILLKVGATTIFEHRKERNFIMDKDKDKVFAHLVDTFMETLMPYVSKPFFPEKYILKCYREK